MCLSVGVCIRIQVSEENRRGIRFYGHGVTRSSGWPDVGTGNWTLVLSKSSTYKDKLTFILFVSTRPLTLQNSALPSVRLTFDIFSCLWLGAYQSWNPLLMTVCHIVDFMAITQSQPVESYIRSLGLTEERRKGGCYGLPCWAVIFVTSGTT